MRNDSLNKEKSKELQDFQLLLKYFSVTLWT